jgi:hypothetical protein
VTPAEYQARKLDLEEAAIVADHEREKSLKTRARSPMEKSRKPERMSK